MDGAHETPGELRILLLGPVRVFAGDRDLTPSSNKASHLLSLLAAHVNQPVTVDTCIGELWAESTPTSPTSTLQTYILNLRGLLADFGEVCQLQSRNAAYMLQAPLPTSLVDLSAFLDVSRQAPHDHRQSIAALSLWRGIAFADLRLGPSLTPLARYADERRREVLGHAYAHAVSTGEPMAGSTLKLLHRAGVVFRADERLLSGFAICLALSPDLAPQWDSALASWKAYAEGELDANLGAGLGATTVEIFAAIEANRVDEARRAWVTHYAS